jgi:fatty-acyl-CoA synthase
MTAAELVLGLRESDAPALYFEDRMVTGREFVAESISRAVLWRERRDATRPPHIGVLLDNTPEHLFWLGAAAISGAVVVGINSTYRGAELERLIEHSDCQIVVTSSTYGGLLDETRLGGDAGRVLRTEEEQYLGMVSGTTPGVTFDEPADEDLYLLIFTSGSTNFPKAVRCTQGRFARTGAHVARVMGLAPGEAIYAPLPFFHSSSLFTGLAAALAGGSPIGTRSRFSASRTLGDIRRIGATAMTYTGKVLNYMLAVPEQESDGENPLRLAIGNEASRRDITSFAARFQCLVRDSYGSTEGVIIIRRDSSMPDGALGTADEEIVVLDPGTGTECPRGELSPDGAVLNLEEATGELVNLKPDQGFEGYYNNEEATSERFRDGKYWSGDLAYRDAEGWFYFAGRSNEWLRVDSENFSAGVVETILSRFEGARSVVVYAVPDPIVGDRVMAALELNQPETFAVGAFEDFLRSQADLGPKWIPTFVRISGDLPKLASLKVDKTRLRAEAWNAANVYWRPNRNEPLRPLTATERASMGDTLDRVLADRPPRQGAGEPLY